MTGIEPTDCDRCGDRYPRVELFEVVPRSLTDTESDPEPPFAATVCSYCIDDLRREVFGGDVRMDNTCLE